jgi:hypothetical protein
MSPIRGPARSEERMRIAAGAAIVVLAGAALAGWRLDLRALLAAYLAAWWFVSGALIGGLANVWLHNLTGGGWGETIRAPLLAAARWLPLACLLFLPVLVGAPLLYPWTRGAGGEPDAAFRHLWLSQGFWTVRSVVYLLVWSALAWIELRAQSGPKARSPARAAACLLVFGFSSGLASVDWIMSLQPEWYSSVFGWLTGTGQMLAGLALAVMLIDRRAARARLPDLGNLLMMYVMTWGYLAYVQFLIIWAADLPREISWYLSRTAPFWKGVAWVLAVTHLAGPFCLLLSRTAKRSAAVMAWLAGGLLAAHLLDCWWLVLPSIQGLTRNWLWLAPLVAACLLALAWIAVRRPPPDRGASTGERLTGEGSHA